MNIIDEYQYYSDDIIEDDKELRAYEYDLRRKYKYVKSLLITSSLSEKLRHPIRLFVTKQEAKRITSVKEGYYKLKKSSILEHVDEESGELEMDLANAAESFKPSRMKQYIKINPVYGEQDKYLLK